MTPDAMTAPATPAVRADASLRAAALLFLAVGLSWVVYRHAAWRSPRLLAALVALAAAQGILHALLPRVRSLRARIAYFVLQTALAIAFGGVSESYTWTVQLLLVLLAEAVAMIRSRTGFVVAGAVQVFVAVTASVVLFGSEALAVSLMHAVPLAVSIVAFGALFQQLAQSRDASQAALTALDAAHRRLVEYAAEVERLTVASERQRFARELHDTLAQGLVGLVLQLEAVEVHLNRGDSEKAGQIVRHARDQARAALTNARTAISDLRSAASLPDAIRDEAERFSAATGIPCAVSVPRSLTLPERAVGHAIRCVAEGLTNVARHARASRASVSVVQAGDVLTVELVDDGIGFDVAAVEGRPGHYGLLGLRERARLAGGHLEIASQPGAGTTLRLHLPRAREEAVA